MPVHSMPTPRSVQLSQSEEKGCVTKKGPRPPRIHTPKIIECPFKANDTLVTKKGGSIRHTVISINDNQTMVLRGPSGVSYRAQHSIYELAPVPKHRNELKHPFRTQNTLIRF